MEEALEAPVVLEAVPEAAAVIIWEVLEAVREAIEAAWEVPAAVVAWEAPETMAVIVDMSTDPYRPVVIMEWDVARIVEDAAAAAV